MNLKNDFITGLLNEDDFYMNAREILDSERNTEYMMLAIDIKHFKLYNEWYGREAGDDYLMNLAVKLDNYCKEYQGIYGYLGNDDFAVLVPYKESFILSISDEIFAGEEFWEDLSGMIPVMGIYRIEDKTESVFTMYDKAALAMATAKGEFKKHYSYYESCMLEKLQEEHIKMKEIRDAMKNHEFTFYVQPQCNISTGKIAGLEALVRWNHKTKGVVAPGFFIPMLEKNGFIVYLDSYTWECVFKWQRSLIDRGLRPVPCSINVSRTDLQYLDVPMILRGLMEKYDISANLVKVEITESIYAELSTSMKDVVNTLHEIGFTVFMDDFGSGYSSLNMLKNINIDVLKLDMDFLDVNYSNQKSIGIQESVINMGRLMGIPVIAEGVQNARQAEELHNMGCLYAQGNYFYSALPLEEFEKILQDPEKIDYNGIRLQQIDRVHVREFLDENLLSDALFNSILGAVAFYEVCGDKIQILRMNEQYMDLMGIGDFEEDQYRSHFREYIFEEDFLMLKNIFEDASHNILFGGEGIIRYLRQDGTKILLRMKVFMLNEKEDKRIYYASLENIREIVESYRKFDAVLD